MRVRCCTHHDAFGPYFFRTSSSTYSFCSASYRSIRRSHAALAASVCAIDASSAHCLLTLAARSSSRWSWWKALAARLYSACALLSLLPAARKALIDGGVSAADATVVMGCDGSDAPSTGSAAVAITNW